MPDATPLARIVAEITSDGEIVASTLGGGVAVLHDGMLAVPGDTLWSVGFGFATTIHRVPSVHWSASRGIPGSLHTAGLFPVEPTLKVDVTAALASLTEASSTATREYHDHREAVDRWVKGNGLNRPRRGGAKDTVETLPAYVVVDDAVRLVTGLTLDVGVEASARRLLLDEGVRLELGSAPDYVAFLEDEWVRSSHWPIVNGRLFAPAEAAGRIFEVLSLGKPREIVMGRVMGLAVLPAQPLAASRTRLADWRTAQQVLDDADDLVEAVRGVSASADDADQLERIISRFRETAPRFGSAVEEFRLLRLIEVARASSATPKGLASILPGLDGIEELVERERQDRRQAMLTGIAAEADAERERLVLELTALRDSVTQAERDASVAIARGSAARQAVDELHSHLDAAIDRRSALGSGIAEEKLSVIRSQVEATTARNAATAGEVAALAAEIDGFRSLVSDRAAAALDSLLADEGRMADLGRRLSGYLGGGSDLRVSDAGQDLEAGLLSDPRQAAMAVRWHAYRGGVEARAIETAVVAASVGLFPLFVGDTANASAIAMAAVIAGPGFYTVSCDPTLISASDLLDPRRCRTEALVEAIQASRLSPDRWAAVALLSVDWAPCGYWLPSLTARRFGADTFPSNLAVIGAAAASGPRTGIPIDALRDVVPIATGRWAGVEVPKSPSSAAWAVAMDDVDDPGLASYREAVLNSMGDLRPNLLRQVLQAAGVGRRMFAWSADSAGVSLRLVADWISAVRDGADPSQAVKTMLRTLTSGSDD